MQAEGYDGELSPAQWMALRYFARANPFSRTPSAFAAFQATTVALRRKLSRHLRQVGTWFARIARTSVEKGAATQQSRAPHCSASRSSQRTQVSSASIFRLTSDHRNSGHHE